ncbi:HEPN domain-containing protein [Dyadobacter fanqingshengii]|uniref:HEPN domain-containing protein n=1 Tax=Dyadobacter fanqingshengii TaxID=2906443 RepID=UPI002078AEE5|nr:HEPN domain-containing protein [Dyadobacter fanqingshengii]USJ36584.1 HEPN domain-containing protein [Dyadobacter fanqingshengii]
MATSSDLRILALARLKEAIALYETGFYDGAYYLSGYAVEFALKAAICKNLNMDIFVKHAVSGNVLKAFQIHDLSDLAVLAGLKKDLIELSNKSTSFNPAWSIVSGWSEQRRYQFGCKKHTVKIFIHSVNTVISWIKQHW